MPEKRKYIRINVVCEADIIPLDEPNSKPIKGVISNVSAAGLGVITGGSFAVGTPVYISFTLPNGPAFNNIESEIVRADTIAEKHYVFVGIDLGKLSQEQRNVLNRYVMELRHKHYSMKLGI